MQKIILLFCITLIDLFSFSQAEYTPWGSNKAGYRELIITAIHDEIAYFNYSVSDSTNRMNLSGEITKSKITFYKGENRDNSQSGIQEKIIREVQSKKSRLYFDLLLIDVEKYPDFLLNTEMFNNYFKPLKNLNFRDLKDLYIRDFSLSKERESDSFFFDYRNVRNIDFAENFEYALVNNTDHESNTRKIELSKIDFIKQIDFKNLKAYQCYVSFFDSEQLLPLLRNCKILGFAESNVLNNQNALFFDSLDVIHNFSYWPLNVEFWNNSYKLRNYKEQHFYYHVDNYLLSPDPLDFPIDYFFNYYLTPLKKMEWFKNHFPDNVKDYSGDYFVKCIDCRKHKKNSEEFEPNVETSDTLLIKGTLQNGKPIGRWFVREDISVPFSVLNFDENCALPVFPQDGSWSFNYHNGQTAIKGDFKAGKKTGKWYFYDFDGQLLMVKSFIEDELNGLSEFYSPDGKRETLFYLHSNGDFVSCITQYSYVNGERILDRKNFQCFNTNEKGTVCYIFSEGFENDGFILEINYSDGTDRTIDRNSREYEEIINSRFLKYLEVK